MEYSSWTPQACFAFILVYLLVRVWRSPRERPAMQSVAILVLGDIGRSPRMMYHAESFAKHRFQTYLVGYPGSQPIPSLRSTPRVEINYLSEFPPMLRILPFVLLAPLKITHQVLTILFTLWWRIPHPPEFIIVQNPPSIPSLALVWFVGRCRGCKVIIDWHNLGYSILALRTGKNHPFVKVAKKFEATFGRTAFAHLFVTQAMRDKLVEEWDLQGEKIVLHDRPPAHFHHATPSETHDLFLRLSASFSNPSLSGFLPAHAPPDSTPLTALPGASGVKSTNSNPGRLASPDSFFADRSLPFLREDRPAVLVSSTSWTPDEDFGILLEALQLYEKRARERGDLPKVLVIVTGKGPLKEKYMKEVGRLEMEEKWEWVRCRSMWLEAEDYPLLLGSADLGISLHKSSSNLDLPMKVVDMFGCGLPVCALNFQCLDELVKDGLNGRIFDDSKELADRLEELLAGFPNAAPLDKLRSSLITATKVAAQEAHQHRGEDVLRGAPEWEWGNWSDNWDRIVGPLVSRDGERYHGRDAES